MTRVLFSFLVLLAACRPAAEVQESQPWLQLDPRPLEPFRSLMEIDLHAGKSPQRIAVLERRSLTFLLDPLLSRVHILDGQYGHTGLTHCLDASTWPKVASSEQQRGSCAEGRVEVHRGFVQTRGQPVGIAVDEDALEVSIVDSLGWLYGVSADVLQTNPWDYLRRDDGVALSVLPPDGFLHAARFEDQLVVI